MLQRLVRRQWSAERPAVGEVVERHRVHVVERADGLRDLQRERELALVLDVGLGTAHHADDGSCRDPHLVEVDIGEPPDEIDAAAWHAP